MVTVQELIDNISHLKEERLDVLREYQPNITWKMLLKDREILHEVQEELQVLNRVEVSQEDKEKLEEEIWAKWRKKHKDIISQLNKIPEEVWEDYTSLLEYSDIENIDLERYMESLKEIQGYGTQHLFKGEEGLRNHITTQCIEIFGQSAVDVLVTDWEAVFNRLRIDYKSVEILEEEYYYNS